MTRDRSGSTAPTLEGLEERLARLEQGNARLHGDVQRWRRRAHWSWALGGLVLLAGAGTVSKVPETLEARNLVVRDAEGRLRGALAVRPDGTPGLALFDETGRLRLSLDLTPHGGAVNLLNGIGRPQAAIAIRPDGTPGVGLFDAAGQAKLSLDMSGAGTPAVNLLGDAGNVRAAFAVRPDGSPGLGLFDAQGRVQVSIDEPADAPVPPAAAAPIH